MKTDLSGYPKKVFEFLFSYQSKQGFTPSITEIKDAVGLRSLRGVTIQLEKLEKLGYIQRNRKTRRSIQILKNPKKLIEEEKINVPVVGSIKAGTPALAQENIEGYQKIPLSLLHGRRDAFLLKVKGDSMIGKNIFPGDYVVVIPQSTAVNGDIVVAYIPEEESATLKIFKKLNSYIALLPANESYEPIIGRQLSV